MMLDAVITVAIALLVGWAAWTFNRLVRLRNRTRSGWSDIDVQLQRRHDLIPQLVEAVQGYARFEQTTLTMITQLRILSRHATQLTEKAVAEETVADLAKQLLAVAEDYPDLKASQNFLSLQEELRDTEDMLQYARRFYNGAVREFNTQLQSFPDLVIARLFNFKTSEFFSADAGAVKPVKIRFE